MNEIANLGINVMAFSDVARHRSTILLGQSIHLCVPQMSDSQFRDAVIGYQEMVAST